MNDLAQVMGGSESLLATSTKMGPMLVAMGKLSPKDLSMILAAQKNTACALAKPHSSWGWLKLKTSAPFWPSNLPTPVHLRHQASLIAA